MRKVFLLVIPVAAVAVLLFFGFFAGNKKSDDFNATERVDIGDARLMIPILDAQNPEPDIETLRKYLRPGDIVVFPSNIYPQVSQLKKEIPGIEIGTGGTSVGSLEEGVSRLPEDVEYLTYDYEMGFTPEWTEDEGQTILYFDRLDRASERYGKKLVAAPVYIFGRSWNWGEVAKRTDIIVVQVQNFQTGSKVGKEFQPETIGENMTQAVNRLVREIRSKSPSTKIFLQLDTLVTENPNDVLTDMGYLSEMGIDGFALWYNPGTSGDTSKIRILEKVLENVER